MKVTKVGTKEVKPEPIGMIRNGRLFLNTGGGISASAAYITGGGTIRPNGGYDVKSLVKKSPSATPIYPGDTIEIQF